MEQEQDQFAYEEKDVKPIILPTTSTNPEPTGLSPNLVSSPKKWSPRSLQDKNRKSAFLPYKHTHTTCNTVLTNLQRGNTQAETPVLQPTEIDFHMKAGQGELGEEDILNEKNVDVTDKNGLTALHWASSYGQYSTVQLLLKCGAQVDKLGPEEESPLILAANGGHHEIVRLLISSKADVNHVDHVCNTALMYAAKGNHPHTCQELLSHGADFSCVNLNDDTAHVIAMENGSTLAQTVIENFIIARLESTDETS